MAARVEWTSWRYVHQVGRQAADRGECLAFLVEPRDRVQQTLGVRMPGLGVQLKSIRLLNDAPGVHHSDTVCDVGNDAEVVRDQDEAHPAFLLKFGQQLHDLGLYRYVQCSSRLIGNEYSRIECDGHRDHDALPHAAGELMGIGLDPLRRCRDLHSLHQPDGLGLRVGPVHTAVLPKHLGNLPADGKDGVEGGERILEDH